MIQRNSDIHVLFTAEVDQEDDRKPLEVVTLFKAINTFSFVETLCFNMLCFTGL